MSFKLQAASRKLQTKKRKVGVGWALPTERTFDSVDRQGEISACSFLKRERTMKKIEGDFKQVGGKYVLLVSRWNSFVVEHLKEGALDTLLRHGVDEKNIDVVYAPGAFEFPLVAQKLAQANKYDAIVALGAVIRGGTPHFEYVAGECTKGLAQVSLNAGVPIAFGVLTVDNIEQAIERSGTKVGNKGAEAATTAIEMVSLLSKIGK